MSDSFKWRYNKCFPTFFSLLMCIFLLFKIVLFLAVIGYKLQDAFCCVLVGEIKVLVKTSHGLWTIQLFIYFQIHHHW